MRSTPSLPLLPGPLWPLVIASDVVLYMGQIEQDCTYAKLNRFYIYCELLEIELFYI